MDRSELIGRWIDCCEALLSSLRCTVNSREEIDKVHQQLERFILTGLLPWENASNFELSPPVIQETRVGFCPTPQATNNCVPYSTL